MNFDAGKLIMYETSDGITKIDVRMEEETVWLSQAQMAELFETTKQNISLHINNIFQEGELDEISTVKEYLTVQKEGNREVKRNTKYYNLDIIISVGYRVKSLRGTQFRIWATKILIEYIKKGFAMNDELLKESGGGNYFKELLERIRDIRSSEKVFYRQILDLFATSVDYNAKSNEARLFFKIVQNKFHYAVNLQTAAELIYNRADSEKLFMGLNTFKDEQPTKKEVTVAKNYLDEKELTILNRLVSAFFDLAELHAINNEYMYMKDWLPQIDDFAKRYGKGILNSAGSVSHEAAIELALGEYKKYSEKIKDLPSKAERDYFKNLLEEKSLLKEKNNDLRGIGYGV